MNLYPHKIMRGVRNFNFLQFDEKGLNCGIKCSRKIRNIFLFREQYFYDMAIDNTIFIQFIDGFHIS